MIEQAEKVLAKCSKCHGSAHVHSQNAVYWVECDNCQRSTNSHLLQRDAEMEWNYENVIEAKRGLG